MQYMKLGRTGLKVSRLCLGTMTFGNTTQFTDGWRIMDEAIANGINFFDTANIYVDGDSETTIGQWLNPQKRHEIIIATKLRGKMGDDVNSQGLSRHHIIHAVEESLRRLQTDYIDLYQTHWFDEETPMEETLSALDSLVQSGKVRYIGCSNHPAWMLIKACWVADVNNLVRYDSLQPHYSIFHRKEFEQELQAVCLDQSIGVIPYSPLAAGFATGKYTRADKNPDTTRLQSSIIKRLINDDSAYDALDVLNEIAKNHDVPTGQIALAWLLNQPAVTSAIIGTRKIEHLHDAIGATEIQLSDDEITRLSDATANF